MTTTKSDTPELNEVQLLDKQVQGQNWGYRDMFLLAERLQIERNEARKERFNFIRQFLSYGDHQVKCKLNDTTIWLCNRKCDCGYSAIEAKLKAELGRDK